MNEEELLLLAKDKESANILAQIDTDENTQLFAKEHGIELSLAEAHKLRETANLFKEKNDKSKGKSELDEASLDTVSAGAGFWNKLGTVLGVTLGVTAAVGAGAAIGYEIKRDQESPISRATTDLKGENIFDRTYNVFKK